jgi:hypothetical protein
VKAGPLKFQFTVVRNHRRIRVEIPAKRRWGLWVLLTVFLGIWVVGEVAPLLSFLRDDTPSPQAVFLVIWLTFWTAAGAYMLYAWAWHLGGQEVIELDDRTLTKKRELFGLGIPRKFNIAEITDLRILPQSLPMRETEERLTVMMAEFWGLRGGIMAFDYGAKTYRFGFGVDEPEAQELMATLVEAVSENQ